MTRLTHSFKSYLRSMQMSRHKLFVFVEGIKTDPYFYGKISQSVCNHEGISYDLCCARQLSSNGGGKQVLLSFFDYLKHKSALLHSFKGKTTAIIFFLDKDIDDLLQKKRRSDHIVYTLYYDVHNHVYAETDLAEAAGASASIDPSRLQNHFNDSPTLLREMANKWREWVKLCLFSSKKRVSCQSNYRVPSQINKRINGNVDQSTYNTHLTDIQNRLSLSTKQFNRAFGRVSSLVDDIYTNDEHHLIFKGKWYTNLIADEIRNSTASTSMDTSGLETRLAASAISKVDFERAWADHFKEPMKKLIRQI